MHRHPTQLLYIWRWNQVLQLLWFWYWVVLLCFNHLNCCKHYHHFIWPLEVQLSQLLLSINSYLCSYPILWCWRPCHSHMKNGQKCHCYPVLQKWDPYYFSLPVQSPWRIWRRTVVLSICIIMYGWSYTLFLMR